MNEDRLRNTNTHTWARTDMHIGVKLLIQPWQTPHCAPTERCARADGTSLFSLSGELPGDYRALCPIAFCALILFWSTSNPLHNTHTHTKHPHTYMCARTLTPLHAPKHVYTQPEVRICSIWCACAPNRHACVFKGWGYASQELPYHHKQQPHLARTLRNYNFSTIRRGLGPAQLTALLRIAITHLPDTNTPPGH